MGFYNQIFEVKIEKNDHDIKGLCMMQKVIGSVPLKLDLWTWVKRLPDMHKKLTYRLTFLLKMIERNVKNQTK